jgi:hypothetical protein
VPELHTTAVMPSVPPARCTRLRRRVRYRVACVGGPPHPDHQAASGVARAGVFVEARGMPPLGGAAGGGLLGWSCRWSASCSALPSHVLQVAHVIGPVWTGAVGWGFSRACQGACSSPVWLRVSSAAARVRLGGPPSRRANGLGALGFGGGSAGQPTAPARYGSPVEARLGSPPERCRKDVCRRYWCRWSLGWRPLGVERGCVRLGESPATGARKP